LNLHDASPERPGSGRPVMKFAAGFGVVGPKEDNYEALEEVCERHHVRRLDLHGSSWAEGDLPTDPSELNFLVEYLPRDEKELLKVHLALEVALQVLFKGREVSLLRTDDIKPEHLRKIITRRRTLLYCAEGYEES